MIPEPLALQAAERIQQLERDLGRALTRIDELERAIDNALLERESHTETISALHDQVEAATQRGLLPVAGDWADLVAWVQGWLCPHIERQTGPRVRWCPRWQEHPEAAMRMQLLHNDYLTAMADPRYGMSGFVRASYDYHLPRLLDPAGPFAGCDPHSHEPPVTLPAGTPAP